jgi:protein O-GlcNAc transferase
MPQSPPSPASPDDFCNLGDSLADAGRLNEAVEAYQKAIALDPNCLVAYANLGLALKEKGFLDESIAAHRAAITLNPNIPETHNNLGNALKDKGHLDEAIAAYGRAVELNPNLPEAQANLGITLAANGQVDEGIASLRKAIELRPNYAHAHGNLLLTIHYHSGSDAQAILREHLQWARMHTDALWDGTSARSLPPIAGRRIRVGYVSRDLRDHVVGRHLLPLIKNHDRKAFEIFCYTDLRHTDGITEQLRASADHWRGTFGQSDAQLAEMIRADGIDLLVDLNLHSAGSRLLAFARKPAPIQVTWLGYCSTTGLRAIDYRLSDPWMDPPGTDANYVEKTIRLPHTQLCYQPRDKCPNVAPPAFEKNGFITFGCLNNFVKISPPALDLWGGVMQKVSDSRLLIHAAPGSQRRCVVERLHKFGIPADRITFFDTSDWQTYMRAYSGIDIALDPIPYSGGITTCDALWMGVPVITLTGQTAVGRAGASILSNVGLREFVAATASQYIQIATDLTSDTARLATLRREMRARMQSSPLTDAAGFARDIESAYKMMIADAGRS